MSKPGSRTFWIGIALCGLLLAAGVSGYAAFTFAERYAVLHAQLRVARRQEKLLSARLDELAKERKSLQDAQLELSVRMADQDAQFKSAEEERRSLLDGIRRLTERNQALARQEEEAAAAVAQADDLKRSLAAAQTRMEELERASRAQRLHLAGLKKQLADNRALTKRILGDADAHLRQEHQARMDRLQAEFAGVNRQHEALIRQLKEQLDASARRSAESPRVLENQMAAERRLDRIRQEYLQGKAVYYYNLGVLCTQNRKFRRAALMYGRALRINPRDAQSHRNLGLLYQWHLNDRRRAIRHYQRFLELSPNKRDRIQVQRWITEAQHEIGHSEEGYFGQFFESLRKLLSAAR